MTDGERRPDWGDVDADAEQAAAYLDTVTGLEAIQEYKRRSYRLLHPTPGDRVLDAGCGVGDDVLALAEHVGSAGEVVGVDTSASLIEEARARADEPDRVRFEVGDVTSLSFADGTFDACRADRVLQHLEDTRGALAELRRVTRPGGRIAVSDPDWDTCLVAAPDADPAVTETVTDSDWADALNPTIGRRLYALVRGAGLRDVEVDPTTVVLTDFEFANEVLYLDDRLALLRDAGAISAEQADRWIERARRADRDGLFFSSLTGFTVAGTVPIGRGNGAR